jgi:tetratricopeptide (TPR) repeat protein
MIICITLLLFAQSESAQSLEEQIAAAVTLGQQTEAGITAGEITGFNAIDAWTDVAYAWEDISILDGAPATVWVNWSEALLNGGNTDKAISIAENGLEMFTTDALLFEQFGRLLLVESRSVASMGNEEKAAELTMAAIAAFTAASENAPETASPLLRLGEAAWTAFVNGGDADPEEKAAAIAWWMAYYNKGAEFWSNVHSDFNKVIELNPAFTNAFFFLADGAFKRGVMQSTSNDDIKAKKAYNFSGKYYALYLKDFGANHTQSVSQSGGLLAECQRMNFLASFTDYEHAIIILEWATSNAPDYLDVWNNLAFLYRETGESEKSLAAYQQALSIQPDDPQIMNDLAVIYHYYLKTEDEIALELYRNAIIRAEEILSAETIFGDDLSLVKVALRDARNNLSKLSKGNRRNG